MDFVETIFSLAKDLPQKAEQALTEEATKLFLVIPFLQALGYDVFNPAEVVPEYTADVGVKEGERVDYAVLKDGEPIMLLECKCAKDELDARHMKQLYRYFQCTSAKIGILTNGLKYQFFTDLDEQNKMDAKPFFELDLLGLKGTRFAKVLKRFTKAGFDIDELLPAAVKLRYTKEIKRVFGEQLSDPSPNFVKFFASEVYSGVKTTKVKELFAECTKEALSQYISDRITDRFQSALKQESEARQNADDQPTPQEEDEEEETGITVDEMQGYYIVKAILCGHIDDPERLILKDMKRGARVRLDSKYKPVCHLTLDESRFTFEVFDAEKKPFALSIDKLSDIYKHADQLKAVVDRYENPPAEQPTQETQQGVIPKPENGSF